MPAKALFVYMTAENRDQARRIGRALVEERLAACVNILDGMESIYWWEGRLEEGREAVLTAKTTEDRLEALTKRVEALHGYACPCVVALPVEGGHPAFLDWIRAETGADRP
jgi:periplasmic divalent cation tolerance protein